MASFKEKLALWKEKHAGKIAKARAGYGAVKPIGIAAGVGFAAQYAGEMVVGQIPMIGDKWYGEGAALLLGSYFMRKRNANVSAALAGAAGYSLALKRKQSGAAGTTSGWEDTGALQDV
jgi:hypothetical protein